MSAFVVGLFGLPAAVTNFSTEANQPCPEEGVYEQVSIQDKTLLHSALPEAILAGKVTDVYFERTKQILEAKGRRAHVVAEFILKKFPDDYKSGLFAGLEEAL